MMNKIVKVTGVCTDVTKRQMLINSIKTICNNSSTYDIDSVSLESEKYNDVSDYSTLYKFCILIKTSLTDVELKDDYVLLSIHKECDEDTLEYSIV